MDQPDLFATSSKAPAKMTIEERLAEGARLRDWGINVADENASDGWKLVADLAIHRVASRMWSFTADDVWDLLDSWKVPHPDLLGFDARAFAARIMAATRRGWCRQLVCDHGWVAYTPSRRPQGHKRPTPVYESLIGPNSREEAI